ncbi:MAG: RsmG family class I SAM-dependent methyltransferase [Pseudomonadota bacterium]|nr:RsmG family class I SAM-dependent methyltransferase [Pseudomonadota bacterium]
MDFTHRQSEMHDGGISYLNRELLKSGCSVSVAEQQQLVNFFTHFEAWNKVHNLTSLSTKSEQIRALLAPCLRLRPILKTYDCILDLGCGGGFPGLVLGILDEEKKWVLVEKSNKKSNFLRFCKQAMALRNIEIHNGDFLQMPIDTNIKAIVSRGSAKLDLQVIWTEKWRAQGCPLISMQSEKSLHEAQYANAMQVVPLDLPGKEETLRVVIIP